MNKPKFRPVDLISMIFISLNLLYILIGWKNVIHPLLHFSSFLVIGLIIVFLNRFAGRSKFLTFLYDWYPFLAFTYFFEATSAVNRVVFSEFLDPVFQKIDHSIFGYQPALIWGRKFDNFFFQELFHFAYFSYYLMMPALGFLLYFRDKKAFLEFTFKITFLFYTCYLIYDFLPVIGGRALEGAKVLTEIYRYGIFTRIMAFIYNNTTHFGGAFPSSHVAVAVGITISAFKFVRWLGWIFIPLTFLLSISTVYCHYHYFVDTIAGIFWAIIIYFITSKIYRENHV
ncbi:MAG: phosphatase PAP2 family protein [Candidatus Cloacimonetes bacterium]|nr:phosphatase PAP2 family protein [Candidatus Cloacimonadota bacterium]